MVPIRKRAVVGGIALLVPVILSVWVGLTAIRAYSISQADLAPCGVHPSETTSGRQALIWRVCVSRSIEQHFQQPTWIVMRFVAAFLAAGLVGMAIGRWSRPAGVEAAALAGAIAAAVLYLMISSYISAALAALLGPPAGAWAGEMGRRSGGPARNIENASAERVDHEG